MPLKRCGSVSARLSVWFSRVSRSAKTRQADVQDFEAAGIERREVRPRRATTCSDACRRASLPRSGSSVPVGKSNAARPDLAGDGRAASLPAQPSGDHQVQDEEQIVVELEDDPLAEPAQADDRAPVERRRPAGRACARGTGCRSAAARAADSDSRARALRDRARRRGVPACHSYSTVASSSSNSPRRAATDQHGSTRITRMNTDGLTLRLVSPRVACPVGPARNQPQSSV